MWLRILVRIRHGHKSCQHSELEHGINISHFCELFIVKPVGDVC